MAARFVICGCCEHGHITAADGFRGPEFCSRDFAMHIIRTGVQWEKLTLSESEELMAEITAAPLPRTFDEVSPELKFTSEVFNQISIEHTEELQDWPMEVIHAVLHLPTNGSTIPAAELLEAGKELMRSSLS